MDKIEHIKQCKNCAKDFSITDKDLEFYKKMEVPEPTFCPSCRQQRKLLQVNQIYLFKRKCDATGKDIISNFPQDSTYKIYDQAYWFSDSCEGADYGKDFDFTRPFFEQYAELSKEVPRPALFNDFLKDENSAYTNYAGKNKNCYLIFDSDEDWDCMYSYGMNSSKNSLDCYRVVRLERCYEAIDSTNCYNCSFISNCENCWDSYFLNNCIGCKNCIFCSNLKNKQYYIENKKVTAEEYQKIKQNFGSYEFLKNKIKEFSQYKLKFPQKFMRGFRNENCSGNYLMNCKNATHCFDSMNIWDGKYCSQVFIYSRNCMDNEECGECELIYESNNLAYNGYNIRFSQQCMSQINNLTYCDYCFRCSDLFGCIGLKRKKYCILNKQYSKEEYFTLRDKIIAYMTKTKEWGEYFPPSLSLHPYNLSTAMSFYPLTKEQALKKGYKWRDEDKKEYQPQIYEIPDNIKDISDSIKNEILACEECGKNYKIIESELKFYRKQNLPIPKKCFHCRHKARIALRNPRTLYKRTCQKCNMEIETTYSPERKEIVYCEKCYLESIS